VINNFSEVVPGVLYRGSAPSPQDVQALKDKIGIKKIVSLDKKSGERIDRACKLLGIEHVKMYIEDIKKTLLHFLTQNLKELFLEGGPTFVHCHHGKDRTGLACALVKCKYLGMQPEKAIKEMKLFGFGIGLPDEMTKLYEKIIRSCKPAKDQNNADIVSNEREYKGDNRDGALDEGRQGSFAPYLGRTKQDPQDAVYTYISDQSDTRQNHDQQAPIRNQTTDAVPQVGVFNNDGGGQWAGPTVNMTGFIYD